MAVISKKLNREYFDQVVSGKKKYELRLNDFDIAEGDTLLLREWDKDAKTYTGREIAKRVTDVSRFKLEDIYALNSKEEFDRLGIQIISIE
jgi:ASC-1-like (ASCH) protein